jgi:hypothetical protein
MQLIFFILALVWITPMLGLTVCALLCGCWPGFRARLVREVFGEPEPDSSGQSLMRPTGNR